MMEGMNISHAPRPKYDRPPRLDNNKYLIVWWHPELLFMNRIIKAKTQDEAIKKYKKYIKDTYNINYIEIDCFNLSEIEVLN